MLIPGFNITLTDVNELPSVFKQTYECFILCVCGFHFSMSTLICFQKTCLTLLWWLIVGAMIFLLLWFIFCSFCLLFIFFLLFGPVFFSLLFKSPIELEIVLTLVHTSLVISMVAFLTGQQNILSGQHTAKPNICLDL